MRVLGIRRVSHRSNREQFMSPRGQGAHEKHDGIHETPRDVATDDANEQRANVLAAGSGGAGRAGKRERHDQTEKEFRDAGDRIEDAILFVHFTASQDASGLYVVIARAAASVSDPRSFWRTLPSWFAPTVIIAG